MWRRRNRGRGYGWWRWNAHDFVASADQSAATAEGKAYCFHPYRMKRRWREADRAADARGRPADRTLGSTEARSRWFAVLGEVLERDRIVRVRHTSYDGPALIVSEARYRELERRAEWEERSRAPASPASSPSR